MNAEELLKLPETKNRLDGYGDKYLINQKTKKISRKQKTIKRTYFIMLLEVWVRSDWVVDYIWAKIGMH